ncbi:bifunctional tetrahydrofolate synthase/dihydrofolate synthase [Alteromonadaceae bacterium M269]|nr:bifunctional tetrahydrofolate synthase/dihydrofolate synthase [Alteromonadaceae bacterium M269]
MSHPNSNKPVSLDDWLCYIEQLHPANIELGLERLNTVYQALNCDFNQSKVITVAGTNGKGTTCAMVEQACLRANKTVAVYSSPHIVDYRERLRINGEMLQADQHCEAFRAIDELRGDVELTYFEFATLAALWLIQRNHVDVILLEIGLGGRLDAVNIVDNDLAVITTIDLDHQDWLGDTRELIGAEKAGIFREKGDAVVGDLGPPQSVIARATELKVNALWQSKDFSYAEDASGWAWSKADLDISDLPKCHIPTQNASTAFAVINWLGIPLNQDFMKELCEGTRLPGRMQQISQQPTVYVDVAHNPQATQYLASRIEELNANSIHFVCGMLKDKDIDNTLLPMRKFSGTWHVGTIGGPRGATSSHVVSQLDSQQKVLEYGSVIEAYQSALSHVQQDEAIIVFGSFLTVADVLSL